MFIDIIKILRLSSTGNQVPIPRNKYISLLYRDTDKYMNKDLVI